MKSIRMKHSLHCAQFLGNLVPVIFARDQMGMFHEEREYWVWNHNLKEQGWHEEEKGSGVA